MSLRKLTIAVLTLLSCTLSAQNSTSKPSLPDGQHGIRRVDDDKGHYGTFKLNLESDEDCMIRINGVGLGRLQKLKGMVVDMQYGMIELEALSLDKDVAPYLNTFSVKSPYRSMLENIKFKHKSDKKAVPAAETETVVTMDVSTVSEAPAASYQIDTDRVFTIVEQMPEYPGGEEELMKFIRRNIQYPAVARDSSIQGRVIVRFTINTDGSLSDMKVVRKVHPVLDAEAVRVSSLLHFIPGRQQGIPVRVSYNLPILFKL